MPILWNVLVHWLACHTPSQMIQSLMAVGLRLSSGLCMAVLLSKNLCSTLSLFTRRVNGYQQHTAGGDHAMA